MAFSDPDVGAKHVFKRPWQTLREAAGIPDVRIHDLRHTFASVLAGQGMSLPVIGRLLGHTQTATTARYAHLEDEVLRDAAERASKAIARRK
jgi:integrase